MTEAFALPFAGRVTRHRREQRHRRGHRLRRPATASGGGHRPFFTG
jgi:hypothetical protein